MVCTMVKAPLSGQTRLLSKFSVVTSLRLAMTGAAIESTSQANIYRGQWQFGEMSGQADRNTVRMSVRLLNMAREPSQQAVARFIRASSMLATWRCF